MNNYETITVDQLSNRAPNAYRDECDIQFGPRTPGRFFAVQSLKQDGSWWTSWEASDETEAIAKIARYEEQALAMGVTWYLRIVVVVNEERPSPVAPPVVVAPVVSVPSEEQLVAAIEESRYSHGTETYISVQNVYQHLRGNFELPRRYNSRVEAAIKAAYPTATYEGGGVFLIRN